jgi:2-keto-4-pentenoate hydratase
MRLILSFILLGTVFVHAGDALPRETITGMADKYLHKQTFAGVPNGLSRQDALTAQKTYVESISRQLGPRIGYKVGLVTKANQERMRASGPVRGVLLKQMLLQDKAHVPISYAIRPAAEADLVVTIKDEGINSAKTIEEAARHVADIVAFIELPDNTVSTEQKMDGGVIEATNVGARAGILGDRVKVRSTPEFLAAFGKMQMILSDKEGKELVNSSAEVILGHPFNALLWLVADLQKTGEKLRAGDVISLGSPVAAITPKAGETYNLRYEGLPGGTLKASVSFN